MKTILILGANGIIGFELLKYFLEKKFRVIAVDKNFSKLKSKNLFNLLKIKLDL